MKRNVKFKDARRREVSVSNGHEAPDRLQKEKRAGLRRRGVLGRTK